MTAEEIARLLEPYVWDGAVPGGSDGAGEGCDWGRVYEQLVVYLELILRWNARMSLTAIREPEEIVRRHFGESLFAGRVVGECGTLLDFGSGAGFPGVPMALMRPGVRVTLAESQGKKAAFLWEVVRSLGLEVEVWGDRVEAMPEERRFDVVTLRAVDRMDAAVSEAGARARERVVILGTGGLMEGAGGDFEVEWRVGIPGSRDGAVTVLRRR